MKTKELQDIMAAKGIAAEKLGPKVGMTAPGFRKALKEGNFKVDVYMAMMKELKLHPSYFFLPSAGSWAEYDGLYITDALPQHKAEIKRLNDEISKLKDKVMKVNDKMVEQTDRFLALLSSKK